MAFERIHVARPDVTKRCQPGFDFAKRLRLQPVQAALSQQLPPARLPGPRAPPRVPLEIRQPQVVVSPEPPSLERAAAAQALQES